MALTEENKRVIDVLALEYSGLRAEILHRSGSRFSMLTLGVGVVPLLIALVENSDDIPWWPYGGALLGSYAAILFLYWFYAGRAIGKMSAWVVELECRINRLAEGSGPLLKWEATAQQRRGWLDRFLLGKPSQSDGQSSDHEPVPCPKVEKSESN